MSKSWRDIARPIIYQVLQETSGKDDKAIRKALRDAYPFGQRSLHPYKIWCDEVRVQRKQRAFGRRRDKQNPNQSRLF